MFIYNIACQLDYEIRGLKYKRITLETGGVILKRQDEKTGMWITLKFKEIDDEPVTTKAKSIVTKVLTGVF